MPEIKKWAALLGLLLPSIALTSEQQVSLNQRSVEETHAVNTTFRVSFADMLTPEDAKAISIRAAELINDKGIMAIADFSRRESGFLSKDGYVFCMSMQAVMLSHPLRHQLVGQSLYEYQRYGQPFFKKMVDVVEQDGEGWVEYKWPYPGTSELRMKMSYVVKNDAGFFCGVSAFK